MPISVLLNCRGFVLFLTASVGLMAADLLETVQPKQMQEVDVVERKDSSGGEGGVEDVLVERMVGIVVGRDVGAVIELQGQGKAGVETVGLDAKEAAAVGRIAAPYFEEVLTMSALSRLQGELESWFSRGDQPMVRAVTPDQEITSGVIGIVVTPRISGDVVMRGQAVFGERFIRENIRTQRGEVLQQRRLMEDLAWINENSQRRVDLTYVEGDRENVSDLQFEVVEREPLQAYVGYDNFANESTGNHRIFAGVRYGNLWGLDHRLVYQYTASPDFEELRAQSLIYEWPLPWRHVLEVTATDSFADTSLAGDYALNGTFRELGIKYWIPLPPSGENLQKLYIGVAYQENDYEIARRGSGLERFVRFFVLQAGYEGRFVDRLGYSKITVGMRFSPGNGIFGIDDSEYQKISPDADARYVTGRLRVDRTWWLPWDSSLLTRAEGQWTDSSLLSSEQFSASGVYDVRGYDESEAFADRAVSFTMEWQSKPFSGLLKKLGNERTRFLAFWDYAYLNERRGTSDRLSGVGVGVRVNFEDHWNIRADVALPVLDELYKDGPRLHLGVTYLF